MKAAVKGASIVIYFGHGNGWPSPYTYDPKYATKDGFGLNATAGNGDYNNKYYGEPYVSTLAPRPERRRPPEPPVLRLGQLRAGRRGPEPAPRPASASTTSGRLPQGRPDAVIADGHGGPEPYIRALFTTHATIEDVWRSAPNFHGHVKSVPLDPDPGRHGLHRHRQRDERLLPLARRATGPDHR